MKSDNESNVAWRRNMLDDFSDRAKGTLLDKITPFGYGKCSQMSISEYCRYLKMYLSKQYISNLYIDIANIDNLDTGYLRIIALKQYLRTLLNSNALTSVPFCIKTTALFKDFGLPIIDEVNELIDTKLEMQRCNELLSEGNVTTIK